MSSGDAFIYGIGVKSENVDRLKELIEEYDIMQSILTEELHHSKPTLSAQILYYTIIPHHKSQIFKLTRDNTWMIFLTSDDCHDEYNLVNTYSFVKVKEFFETVFPKDEYTTYWETGEFLKHLDEWMYIAHSHYDTHEEWKRQFTVREYRKEWYHEVECCANCAHERGDNCCLIDGALVSPAGHCSEHDLHIAFKEEG